MAEKDDKAGKSAKGPKAEKSEKGDKAQRAEGGGKDGKGGGKQAQPSGKGQPQKGDKAPKAEAGDDGSKNVYSRAAEHLRQWREGDVLVQDGEPSIYYYSQEFIAPGETAKRTRRATRTV